MFKVDDVLINNAKNRATGADVHDVNVLIGKYRNAAMFAATYQEALWYYTHSKMTLKQALAEAAKQQ